jgi:hypothetical protein
MTSATSLIFIAVGAILAFAVTYRVAGMNIQTVGAILIIVGAIGLAVSLATLAGYAPWGANRAGTAASVAATPPPVTPPSGPPAST